MGFARRIVLLAVWVSVFCAVLLGTAPRNVEPWSDTAAAAEQYPSSPSHRGIAPFDPYLVFPENRSGNGVYLDNQLIFETPDLTIVDVLPLPVNARFVYFALTPQGGGTLGVSGKGSDAKPRVTEVAPGFFHATMVLDGVVYRKMYRIVEQNILDLLPNSKTPDGPVAGPVGVAFYHVASNERVEQDGQTKSVFGLRLHLALYEDERLRNLNYAIDNDLPSLKITWLDDRRLQVGLANGRTEIFSLAQFQ